MGRGEQAVSESTIYFERQFPCYKPLRTTVWFLLLLGEQMLDTLGCLTNHIVRGDESVFLNLFLRIPSVMVLREVLTTKIMHLCTIKELARLVA